MKKVNLLILFFSFLIFQTSFAQRIIGGQKQVLNPSKKDLNAKEVQILQAYVKTMKMGKSKEEKISNFLKIAEPNLLNDANTALSPNTERFSFKKDSENAKFYKYPVVITEARIAVRESNIGFGVKARRGKLNKYFIAKEEGVAGRPAPITIFVPNDGGEPKIYGIGSL